MFVKLEISYFVVEMDKNRRPRVYLGRVEASCVGDRGLYATKGSCFDDGTENLRCLDGTRRVISNGRHFLDGTER